MRHYQPTLIATICALQSAIALCHVLPACAQANTSATALNQTGNKAPERLAAPTETNSGSQGARSVDNAGVPLRGINNNLPATAPNTDTDTNNSNGVSSAPGADAMMTPDFLLVNPSKTGAAPKPLQSFVGDTLKVSIDRSNISLPRLHGLMITVTNDTSRPLVVNGDNAKAMVGTQIYVAASVATLQKSVLPSSSFKAGTVRTIAQVIPAAVTVGFTPTVEDYIRLKQPVRKRYGADEKRRFAESSRFGKRILWPHQKTQGILYFQTAAALADAKLQIPVQTLFDAPDSAVLENK